MSKVKMEDTLNRFNNDLICVNLYAVRMYDRMKYLLQCVQNEGVTAFDLRDWAVRNEFIESKANKYGRHLITERGRKYLEILKSANDKGAGMYFNATTEQKNADNLMKGYPLYEECSLYEDVTHRTPTAKLGLYLNPPKWNEKEERWEPPAPFDATWVKYDGKEYTRK